MKQRKEDRKGNGMHDYIPMIQNEILFSYIIRYHQNIGTGLYLCHSYHELLEAKQTLSSIHFIKYIKVFLEHIQMPISTFLNEHTILPYSYHFLKPDSYRICLSVATSTGNISQSLVDSLSFSSKYKDTITYCPVCINQASFSDRHFERILQFDGISICPKHKCFLNYITRSNRRNYDDISLWGLDLRARFINIKNPLHCFQYKVTISLYQLMTNDKSLSYEQIRSFIRIKLKDMNAIYNNKIYITFEEQYLEYINPYKSYWQNYYLHTSLYRISSVIILVNIHPVEYIMGILYLFGSMDEFLKFTITKLS